MPFFQIHQKKGREPKIASVGAPDAVRSDEQKRTDAMRAREHERESDQYSRLVAKPIKKGDIVISEETRKRLENSDAAKAAVSNVVTTHSDIAKVASGEEIALVPTVAVYTKDDPTEKDADKLVVEDRTVTLAGVPQGETALDKAESSLAQPEGDEYSAKSATGPTLPEGNAVSAEKETEPAFDVKDTSADRAEKRLVASKKAAKAAPSNRKRK